MSPKIASYGKTLLGTFEKVILPFHNLALLLTFISTLSIHGLILGFIEPVYPVLISLLITFPFTVGLTIIFLVLYNYKWNQINGSRIIVGLSLFTLLFLLLSSISSALGLSEYATKMYQPARFFSGIAIALFFAYYIQKLIIKRMQIKKASIIH